MAKISITIPNSWDAITLIVTGDNGEALTSETLAFALKDVASKIEESEAARKLAEHHDSAGEVTQEVME